VRHDYLWWYHSDHRAIRMGDWKLVSPAIKEKNSEKTLTVGRWELYDLSVDRSEMNDLAARQPERARELEQAWTQRLAEFRELAMQDLPAEETAPVKP
jgi:arylsulfatase A-like enzyme